MTQQTTKLFKALSNPNRLAIFQFLRQQERLTIDGPGEEGACNVGDIADQFDLALSTISHHLRVLHESGLIKCEQRGQFTYCVINWETVQELRDFFGADALPLDDPTV